MSYCKCSAGMVEKDHTKHSEYCPIYMRERIKELEAENKKLRVEYSELLYARGE